MDVLSLKQINNLLLKISIGDRAALKQLYEALRMPLFMYIKTILKKQEPSEDITQQVFVEIMGSVCSFKHGTNGKAWIFSIARNVCIDYIKREKREIAVDDKTLNYNTEHLESLDEKTMVYEALNKLNDMEKQIIVLYVYAGFTQIEISKLIGIPYIKTRSMYGYAI